MEMMRTNALAAAAGGNGIRALLDPKLIPIVNPNQPRYTGGGFCLTAPHLLLDG